jgi:predicted metal-dependent HD superfamily phosphohydrolase
VFRDELNVPNSLAVTWAQTIATCYREPQRHYHTLAHLQDMFDLMDEYFNHVRNKTAVFLSIIFHDIVYDPTASETNARASPCLKDLQTKSG